MIARLANVGGDLLALHHALPAVGELLFLAGLDGELRQLLVGVAGEIGLGLGGGDARALGLERALGFAHRRVGARASP